MKTIRFAIAAIIAALSVAAVAQAQAVQTVGVEVTRLMVFPLELSTNVDGTVDTVLYPDISAIVVEFKASRLKDHTAMIVLENTVTGARDVQASRVINKNAGPQTIGFTLSAVPTGVYRLLLVVSDLTTAVQVGGTYVVP